MGPSAAPTPATTRGRQLGIAKTQAWSTSKEAHIVGTTLKVHRYRAPSSSPLRCSLTELFKSAGHPPRALHTTQSHLNSRPSNTTSKGYETVRGFPEHQPSPVAFFLQRKPRWCQPVLMGPPWLPTAEGASVRRLSLPVTHWLSPWSFAMRSRGSRLRRVQQETACRKVANVGKATCDPDPVLDPRILHHTSAALWEAGYRSLGGYLSAARQEMVLTHGLLPEAFGNHFGRIK